MKCLKDTEYEDKAQLLNLDSMSFRMDKGNMILVYKIPHGLLEDGQWRNSFQVADTKTAKGWPRLDLRKFTFSQRVVDMCNDLPTDVAASSSVKAFEDKLEAHLENLPRRSPE